MPRAYAYGHAIGQAGGPAGGQRGYRVITATEAMSMSSAGAMAHHSHDLCYNYARSACLAAGAEGSGVAAIK